METIIEIWAQVDGEKCGGEEAAGDDAVENRKWVNEVYIWQWKFGMFVAYVLSRLYIIFTFSC